MSVEIRLLYVDDNPLDRELVRDALAHDTVSFQVTEAASRAEFEACLGPGRYDLVLSDFNILGFQGLQVLAAVKAVDPGVPVVIVTGTGSEEVAVEAMKRGAADYVIKDPRRIQRLPRTLRAILEQARQRQAAAEATARYRELFRSVPVALYRFTLDGDVFFANPAFLALLGLAESERFRHLPLTDLFVSAADLTNWLQRLDREGLVRGFEAQWRRQDGSLIWTRAHARAVRDEHFQVLYCEGSLEDITERKQAEATLRYHASLMEQVSDAVMSTDAEFRVVSWNPAAEAIYGYTAAEMLGRPVGVLVDPAFPAEEREQLRAEFVRQGYWHSEIHHRHKDGRPLIIHSSVTALRGPDGQFQGAVGVNRDITAARQAEAERQAQAARYQLALEGADLGTWDWNVATGEVAFNARWCAMLGYAPEEVAPDVSVWRHLLHPADQPAVEAVLQAHLAGQTPAYETEHRLRHKAGAWVWVLDRGRVIERDAAGRPLRMCGTHLDITERKQAEAGLRASAAQYQAILETAQDGFWLVDERGRFLDMNDAYCRLIGYSRAELLGMTIMDVEAVEAPADTAARIAQIKAAGYARFESRHRARDGRLIDVEVTVTFVPGEGGGLLVSFSHDITARAQAERALRYQASLVENVSDAVISTDADFKIITWNPAAEAIYGWPAAEAVGQPVNLILDLARDGDGLGARQAALRANGFWRGELAQRRQDGTPLRVLASITALRDARGQFTGTVAVNRDITELKAGELAQRRYQLLAQHSRDIFLFMRADGRLLEANQTALEAYGYTADEMRQLHVRDLRDPETLPALAGQLETARQGAAVFETVHRRRDGRTFPVEVRTFNASLDGEEILVSTIRDVTERRRAEAVVRESERRYRALFEQSHDAIFVLDLHGWHLDVNERAAVLLGYTRAELLTLGIQAISAEVPESEQILQRLQRGEHIPSYERLFRRKTGELVPVEVNVELVRDAAGQPTHIQSVARDITERKRAEAALRAGEARFRSLVEAQADLVMRADPQFRVTFVNDAFCRTFNRTPAQILGQPVVDQVPPSEHTVVLARLAALNEPPYQSSGENRNLTAAGERWFAWANTAIRDEAGRVVEYQMVGRDVTEQRAAAAALQESEARYRSLVESATDGIILMDAAERILVFNPAAERIFGYAAAEILGQSVRRLMPAEHGAHHSASVQHHLATGQATLVGRTAQLTGRRRNGEAFPLELSLSSVATADGPIFTSIIRDISDRRRLEAAAQASEARFRQLFEAMQEGFALHEVICDAAGRPVDYRFLDVNPAFAALTGLEREQVVGRTVLEVLPETEPYWIETYGRVAQTGESVRLQNFSRALDRRYEVIAFRPAPGQFATIVADITERQKTEAALRLQGAALNAAADGIVITDPAGVIQWVNPAYTRLTGYPAEAALGQNPRLLKSGRHDQAFYRELWATIKAGHTWQGEIINRRQDGRLYEEEQTITPVLDEAGQITHFVAIKRDISARKQRERELASLAQVSAALRVAAGRAEMPPIILDQLAQLLQVRGAALALRDEAGDQPGLQLAQGNWVDFTQLRLPPDEALLRHVLETGQAYQCDDVRADPRFYQGLPLREQFAVACVPLIAQQAVIGVLWAARQWPFQEAEARVLASVADIAASALHRATLHAQTQHRAEQLAEVSAAGQVLAEILDPEQVYDRLHQIIMRLFPDSGIVFISLYEAERQQISAAFGMEGGRRLEVADLPPLPLEPQGIQSEVILTRRPLIVDDLPARLAGVQHQHIVGDASQLPRSALYVPMLARGRVVGVIQLQSHRARRYSAMEAELLTVVANTAAVALENARLFAEVRRRLEQLQALHRVDQAIASSQDARLTLSVLLTQLVAQTGADAADLLVLNPGQQTLEYLAGLGFHGRPFTEPLPLAEDSRAAQAVLERRLAHLPDLAAQPLADPRGAVLAREGFVTYLAAPLVAQGQVKGVLELFHRSAYRADAERLAVLDLFAGQAAIAVENAELFLSLQRSNADLRQAYDATIEGWSRALDMRDKETEGHTRRVTEITLRLARAMGLDDDALIHVRRGALLHDIGKMGVPDGILLKPGPLTAEEWVVMRQHPQYAHDMLAPIAFLRPALEIPYCHHEKWDGSGYPRGLAGEAIPLAARIFAVVDVWDALNSDRPYRPAWPAERIRAHIRGEAGRHFDPRVVETFLRLTL